MLVGRAPSRALPPSTKRINNNRSSTGRTRCLRKRTVRSAAVARHSRHEHSSFLPPPPPPRKKAERRPLVYVINYHKIFISSFFFFFDINTHKRSSRVIDIGRRLTRAYNVLESEKTKTNGLCCTTIKFTRSKCRGRGGVGRSTGPIPTKFSALGEIKFVFPKITEPPSPYFTKKKITTLFCMQYIFKSFNFLF